MSSRALFLLILLAGCSNTADAERTFARSPAESWTAARAVGARQERWTETSACPAALTARWEAKSAVFGFIDDVSVAVAPAGSGSRVSAHSGSRAGKEDFGANRRRLERFFEQMEEELRK